MTVYRNDDLPIHDVPRIRTRILAGPECGSVETAVWEQWIDPGGFIPLHYHEVEEVLVVLAGEVELTIESEATRVDSPATVIVPARQIHGLRPAGGRPVHLLAFFPAASPEIFSPDGVVRPKPWEDVTG